MDSAGGWRCCNQGAVVTFSACMADMCSMRPQRCLLQFFNFSSITFSFFSCFHYLFLDASCRKPQGRLPATSLRKSQGGCGSTNQGLTFLYPTRTVAPTPPIPRPRLAASLVHMQYGILHANQGSGTPAPMVGGLRSATERQISMPSANGREWMWSVQQLHPLTSHSRRIGDAQSDCRKRYHFIQLPLIATSW